jgi:hypothetical protein
MVCVGTTVVPHEVSGLVVPWPGLEHLYWLPQVAVANFEHAVEFAGP